MPECDAPKNTPGAVVDMPGYVCKIIADYAREEEKYMPSAKTVNAFHSIASTMYSDEISYVMQNFEECVNGITEEEFEEWYEAEPDNIPFVNLRPSTYRDLRVLEDFFSNFKGDESDDEVFSLSLSLLL